MIQDGKLVIPGYIFTAPFKYTAKFAAFLAVTLIRLTIVGEVLLRMTRGIGFKRSVVEGRELEGSAATEVTIRQTPRWATWLLGGRTTEVVAYSDRENDYLLPSGQRLKGGKELQRKERAYWMDRRFNR